MIGIVRDSGQMGRLGMVGIDFQRGEQKGLAARLVTAAFGFDRHEYRIYLGERFRVVTL